MNNRPFGLTWFCRLRSWRSQWRCGPDIAVPALVIGYLADDACIPSHTQRLLSAIRHPDKAMDEIPGADHYDYSGSDQHATPCQAVGICSDWLKIHEFAT